MAQFLEFTLMECSVDEELPSLLSQKVACVCCLSQETPYVYVPSCTHLLFLEHFLKSKISHLFVCVHCHSMLKKFEDFKRQVEKCVQILNSQVLENKAITPKLQRSDIKTTSYTESQLDDFNEDGQFYDNLDVMYKKEKQAFITEVKIENDFSDMDLDMPLAELRRQTEGDVYPERVKKKVKKDSKATKVETSADKYEGKIRTLTLSREVLLQEREMLKMDQKYLRLPYKCEDCVVSFEFEMAWKNHMEKHHNKKKNSHTCDICKSVLSSASSYKEHSKRHLRRFECFVCRKWYHNEYSAVQHYNDLHGQLGTIALQFDCEECDFVTDSHRSYRYHRSKHKNKPECAVCGHLFVSAYNLKLHMYTVHKQSTRVFECEPCGKVYKGKSGLFAHMRTAHETCDERAYCADCRMYYRTRQNLAHHLRTHSNHIAAHENRFECNDCDAKFIRKSNLKTHIEWEHLGVREHRCPKCSKVMKTARSLRNHVAFVHDKKQLPRDKMCDYCGKGFTTKTILDTHIRTHTGERPHRCTHCSATFAHSAALYNHNKLIHNPNRIK